MKLFIMVLVFVTVLALASGDDEESETTQDDYSIIVPEMPRNKYDCIVVEVCNIDGDCQWRLTCP